MLYDVARRDSFTFFCMCSRNIRPKSDADHIVDSDPVGPDRLFNEVQIHKNEHCLRPIRNQVRGAHLCPLGRDNVAETHTHPPLLIQY